MNKRMVVRIEAAIVMLLAVIGCQPQAATSEPSPAQGGDAATEEAGAPASAEPPSQEASQEVTTAPTPTTAPSDTPSPTAAPLADASAFDPLALDMLARLNDWRAGVGVGPLASNSLLQSLAQAQFDYLLSLPVLPDGLELHVDANGQYAKERAIAAGWPHYSTDVQTALSEIICVNAGPAECIGWWQSSESHRIAATNPGFREVGVAGGPWAFGTVYVATLGARPNVLPTLIDPVSQQIYLGTERYPFAGGGNWIGKVTDYQILPSVDSVPADDSWQPWSMTIPLPDTTEPHAVAYTDGTTQVISSVDPRKDTAWLPVVLEAIATPVPTTTITPTAANSATPAPTATATATPTPRRTATPEGPPGIVFVYDANSLTVTNTTDSPVDLTKILLTNGTEKFALSQFQAFSLSLPLNLFPADGCIQAWNSSGAVPKKPAECKVLYSSMNITADQAFWGTSDFEIQNDGKTVAECTAAAGRCVAELP